jgi:transforming growth factor-beta-induced protein
MPEEKQSNNKILIIAVIVIVLVVAGVAAFVMLSNNNENDDMAETEESSMSSESSESGVIVGGAELLPSQDLVENLSQASILSTLVTAVTEAELVETLQGDGPFTVFAPTNTAFDALPEGTLDELLLPENQSQLADVLTFHVVAGEFLASDLSDGQRLTTVQGDDLIVYIQNGEVTINGAVVSTADAVSSNGVIHVIDSVLLPPSDEATVGDVTLPRTNDIVANAVLADDLSTLVTAVTEADLVETLSDETASYTVFAPVNAGFDALPAGTLDTLLEPANIADLQGVLTYHVVEGSYSASQLYDGQTLTTLNGEDLTVSVTPAGVQLIGAESDNIVTVAIADIFSSNGVVHAIDGVLLPADDESAE